MRYTEFALLALVLPSVLAGTSPARGPVYPDRPIASDWCTTGTDCTLFVAADLNADRFAEVLTINSNHDLCAAYSVSCWKTASWIAVRGEMPADTIRLLPADIDPRFPGPEILVLTPDALVIVSKFEADKFQEVRKVPAPEGAKLADIRVRDGVVVTDAAGKLWRLDGESLRAADAAGPASVDTPLVIDPPPYEPSAELLSRFPGDFNGDGITDWAGVYRTRLPHEHHVVRIALAPNLQGSPQTIDRDSDGLTDEEEARIGTNPLDRDTDMDGLLDGWEVHGLPRDIQLGERIRYFDPASPKADNALNPLRQDVICVLSYFEGIDPKQMEAELPRAQGLYRALNNQNPDGTTGVWVHFRVEPTFVSKPDQALAWWDVGNKYFAAKERGFMHWMQITPWGGGQSGQTAEMGGAGNNWAVFAHEFGHQLSLSHEGDSAAAWCPLYPSIMNYAFSYGFDGDGNKIHFSNGEFRETVLDEHKLVEKLPYPYEHVKYLANWPFRFPVKDNGDGTTLIDWNQNGKFDDGPVEADINYGGSTYCGNRLNHEYTGSAPALAYVGDVCYLVAADQSKDHLWIKSYQGDEKWSEKRDVPASGTERDPVIVGGKDAGLIFHHHLYGWHVNRFTDKEVGSPVKVPDVPTCELSACRVGDRILLVSRHDDDGLEYRWLTFKDNDPAKPSVTPAVKLDARSLVPPGLGVDPADGRILLVSSMPNSRGANFCMRITWISVQGDRLWEQETKWTRGEGSGNGCCSRPVVAFTNAGQLNIFHQGGPDGNGQMIAYRTSRVGNDKLDEGWLTCMLYDVWTRSRVGVAFANGPQGAIYSYRWDAGGTNNMLQTAHNGFGIDNQPMRDFNDGEKISKWGIRHSILNIRRE